MNAKHIFNKMFANILSIVAILAIAFPAMGSVSAEESVFLESSHDGAWGEVIASGCDANGWAVDPDNRLWDVQIQVFSDGLFVAESIADVPRGLPEELCPDGKCGFHVPLSGLIEAGVPHEISVQAYDPETDQWLDLGGTPKSLTCWGYPEGFHDGVEGETDDVNSCSAFGWVSDPDDRDRDLEVQILADGEIVAVTSANQIREDLDVCPDGSCAFNVSLWGLISPDEEHQIIAQAYDEETDAWYDLGETGKSLTCDVTPPPDPWFTVFPEQGFVEGWNWPLGATLLLTIDNGDGGHYSATETSIITPWDSESNSTWVWFDFSEDFTVQLSGVVTVSLLGSGMLEQTHIVQNLSVTIVDQMDDTVKGVADLGAKVHVWPYAGQEQLAIAKTKGNAAGKWNADLSGIYDLAPGECGRSEIYDESGNRTAVDWCVPSTRFTVWPEWNYLEGYEWPARDEVSISVAGKEEACSTEVTPAFPEWDPWNTFFSVNFPEGCNLEAGDLITLSSETFNLIHQIQDLAITNVDLEYDTVEDMAVFDSEQYILHTWVHDADGSYMQLPADSGDWLADFGSSGFDLQPGMGGRVELVDLASNATAVDWHIPLPSFAAYMPSAIEGYDWPMGHEITLTINGDEYIAHATSEQRPDFPDGETRVLFELWRDEFSMETGDHILMTDEILNFTKELYVADLQVAAFNLIDRTVSGVYDPDRSFWTQLEGQDPLGINFEGNTWAATFADMTPGTWGYVAQDDWDHDGTVWDFQVPDTYVAVANHEDWIDSGIAVSAGQSFTIEAFGLMNPCLDTYPNGSEICIFYTPVGGEWAVPDENEYGIFPGPGLPFMALLGRIGDDGEPFYVGEGGSFTVDQNGRLWFTPNDNLRTDNQGAYGVLVWLE
ncbi:MAG TPA: hypothetical protein VLA72_04155 [Anaerolineales bacterium]|nr:hypothetical protein [Anaerolineales bacterium]